MRKKILFFTSIMVSACFSFSSCDKDEDEDTTIEITPIESQYSGTVIANKGLDTEFTGNGVSCDYTKTGDNTLTINFYNIQFAEKMPVLTNLIIEGVTYSEENDVLTISGDNLVPKLGTIEFPTYTITGLTGEISTKNITLNLNVGSNSVEYQGTK